MKLCDTHSEGKQQIFCCTGEESRSTWNTNVSLEFPEGTRGQRRLAAQPARLALPCPAMPCPARLPSGAWLPSLASTTAMATSAGLAQDGTQPALDPAQPFSGALPCPDELPVTRCVSPLTSAAVQNAVCSLSCFGGTLPGGHWFHCVCGSPQP